MTDEDNIFAMPPSEDAPPPPEEPVYENMPDYDEMPPEDAGFAAPPDQSEYMLSEDDYIGQVDETMILPGDDPIVLAPPDDNLDEMAMSIISPMKEEEEPTGPSPMQIWNEQWQETLLTRKDEENAKKAEFVESARLALEEFQNLADQKREAKMAKNRQDEQEKLEAIEAELETDNPWQRVCKMVDLSHDAADGSADVGRMRDVLITLKNDTAKAVELGA
jgi:hypothetical protein